MEPQGARLGSLLGRPELPMPHLSAVGGLPHGKVADYDGPPPPTVDDTSPLRMGSRKTTLFARSISLRKSTNADSANRGDALGTAHSAASCAAHSVQCAGPSASASTPTSSKTEIGGTQEIFSPARCGDQS